MREDSAPAPQEAPDGLSDAGQMLDLIERAWERSRDAFDTDPVPPNQTRVMDVVDRMPGINMGDLGRQLAMAAPSVSRMCDRLQAAGLLRRTSTAEDRREVQLRLTDVGAAHLGVLRHRRQQFLRETMNDMAPTARRALATGLSAFCEAAAAPPQTASRPYGHRRSA
ncbi:MarR family winged helix-turn-helix transcriptional regulator [Streptomyces sp. B1I3]|uniref:MarR family winged helix-turn-helix transcriptional regulator n=1 Tax=Streptomyces sp. B1I3 TaxID=3042264 RepID=UPI002783D03D|nr:MarR family transcriptional regulator [Streptomyces sp. B1I3]MDQ0795774.1 DNA-binding MarR family transcriptional regulator [Streptomyces sp. B1I3]